ncbi:MAG: hypothetical protein GXP46_01860 [Deferribacteres bacterium]|nr:hypothetical protein [Deferribacteres bacterium]
MKKIYRKIQVLKAADMGAEISPEMLAKINAYTLKELSAEDVYVRKFLLAHNAIDRDNERFPEALIDEFADTLPGKGFLIGHERPGPGRGLFFDAATEEMPPERFVELTGETPRLPAGVETVKVLWGWMYLLREAFNEEIMANLDAGIYRHVSIGFRAADLNAVKADPNGAVLYWEYVPPGEATEGSLVWLGAQPGATAQKAQKTESGDIDTEKKGGKEMNEFLKRLSLKLGKTFSEDNAEDEIMAIFNEKDAKLKELENKVAELEPLAADGRAYRKELVDSYVTLRTKLEELPADDENRQKQAREIAAGFPVEFLKSEVEVLQKRVEEKFPDEGQLKGGDPDNRDKNAKTNPLVPDDD